MYNEKHWKQFLRFASQNTAVCSHAWCKKNNQWKENAKTIFCLNTSALSRNSGSELEKKYATILIIYVGDMNPLLHMWVSTLQFVRWK